MRWLNFIMFSVAWLLLQATVGPRIEVFGLRPDFLLVLVVFLSMHARPGDAVIASWAIGMCADMMTIERLGLLALSYSLVALVVTSVRDHLFHHLAITQFAVTFVMCLAVRAGWLIYRRLLYDFAEPILVDLALDLLLVSVYTAAWAPLVYRLVFPLARTLGIPHPRYTYAGLHRLGGADV